MEILQLLIIPTLLLIASTAVILYLVYSLGVEQDRINQHRDIINRSYNDFLGFYENDRYFSKRDLNKWLEMNKETQKHIGECIKHEEKVRASNRIIKALISMLDNKPLDEDLKKGFSI